MTEPFIAEIRILGCNFAPRGWAFCNGQILPISQNTALFSLVGVTYGGNGISNFALPNLQGSATLQPGQGDGLTPRELGETGGDNTVTLLQSQMPAHNHGLGVQSGRPSAKSPQDSSLTTVGGGVNPYQTQAQNLVAMNAASLATPSVGGNQPHNNQQPYLALNFVIALIGIFPPRPPRP